MTTRDTAASLVFHHPELCTSQPHTATTVLTDHVDPSQEENPDQYNDITQLTNVISGQADWSPTVPCVDHLGNPIKAGYQLSDKTGTIEPGQQMYTWAPTDQTMAAAVAPICGAKKTATNDVTLQNQSWSVQQGTSSIMTKVASNGTGRAVSRSRRIGAAADPLYKWTLDELTPNHGCSVDLMSIHIDPSNNFSIDVINAFMRTLYAYYVLCDKDGNPIGKPTEIRSVGSVNSIMGIPAWTDPTKLSFNIGQASEIKLMFGGLGTSDWNGEVSPKGALLTGCFQYGIPAVFMIAGKIITSTETFNKIVSDPELTAMAAAIAFGLVGGAVPTAAALLNTKMVLTSFASVVISFAVQKGLEALGEWLLEQVAVGELSNAFGPIGWIFKGAAVLLGFENIAITTGEVLSSPATITTIVKRAINVTLELKPDPKHGEWGKPETAVWPALAQKYLVTLQYKQGTGFQLTGRCRRPPTTPLSRWISRPCRRTAKFASSRKLIHSPDGGGVVGKRLDYGHANDWNNTRFGKPHDHREPGSVSEGRPISVQGIDRVPGQ